jgi:hypothetical protein
VEVSIIPSPLYKYRTIESWSFLEDILSRRRLYAASFRSLNDPMEGLLYEHDKDVSVKYRKTVRTASGRLNICSLCDSRDDTLLWSYYAGGHTGVAIGVNVLARQSPRVDEPVKVTYDMTVNIDPRTEQSQSPSEVAKCVLKQKLTFWEHEKEYRAFTTQRFVPVEILEVLVGCKATKEQTDAVRALTAKHLPSIEVIQLKRSELRWPGYQ